MVLPPLLGLLALLGSSADAAPLLTLYTMGPGDNLFSRYGHAALCVEEPLEPGQAPDRRGKCYSYGNTDYSSQIRVIWQFVRREGMYWGSLEDERPMIKVYRRNDQSIWRQTLRLPDDQALHLSALLADSLKPEVKFYLYHHFHDNCSTRIRDPLDRATGGALSRGNMDSDGPSFREIAETGLSGNLPLQIGLELGLGRETDHRTSPWERMLLPEELRTQVAQRLGAQPEVVYTRKGLPPPDTPREGRDAVALAGLGLALPLWALGRWRPGWARKMGGLILGLPGLAFWSLAVVAALTEFRYNEALAILWPTDLLLGWMRPDRARRYLNIRLLALLGVAILWAAGVLVQPLGPDLLCFGLPLLALRGLLPFRARALTGTCESRSPAR